MKNRDMRFSYKKKPGASMTGSNTDSPFQVFVCRQGEVKGVIADPLPLSVRRQVY
jgi:hypothetical protein